MLNVTLDYYPNKRNTTNYHIIFIMLILSQLCLNFCSNISRINVLQKKKKKGKGKRDGKNGA